MPDYSFGATPTKTISVLHRPKKTPSKKNAENIDVQYEKDKEAFERHARSYRKLAENKWHHNRSPGSILTLWEAGHIVDKGKGKAAYTPPLYDPILQREERDQDKKPGKLRSASAPHERPTTAAHRQDKQLQQQRGRYNPLTHEYAEPADTGYESQKAREFDRNTGIGRGIALCKDMQSRDTFNPILGEYRSPAKEPPAPAQSQETPVRPARPSSAPRAIRSSGTSSSPAPAERSCTPGKRPVVAQSDSWGTYDPILHRWQVPPRDERFVEQNLVLNKQAGISGSQLKKVATPPSQGVYNPITNTWKVAPADPRIAQGLSFAPATLFSKPTAATIRT